MDNHVGKYGSGGSFFFSYNAPPDLSRLWDALDGYDDIVFPGYKCHIFLYR